MNAKPDLDDNALAQSLHAGRRQLEDAPPALIRRAIDLWQPQAAPAPGLLRRLLATLDFDSATTSPLALGLRSGGAPAARQLLFSADGRDIDLRLVPSTATAPLRWTLSGQLLGPDTGATAELQVGQHAARIALDELAEFRFELVPEGECRLTLRSGDWILELPPFRIPFAA